MTKTSPSIVCSGQLVKKATLQGTKRSYLGKVSSHKREKTRLKPQEVATSKQKTRAKKVRTPVNTLEYFKSGQGSRLKKAKDLLSEINTLTPKIISLTRNDYLLMDKNLISIENTEFINQIESIGNKLINTGKTMISQRNLNVK